MSTTTHTPERWTARPASKHGSTYNIYSDSGELIAAVADGETAQRITACHNALANFPDPERDVAELVAALEIAEGVAQWAVDHGAQSHAQLAHFRALLSRLQPRAEG